MINNSIENNLLEYIRKIDNEGVFNKHDEKLVAEDFFMRLFELIYGWKSLINLNYTEKNGLRNNVRLIGNLGDNPKVTKLESGKTVANFSIATNETYKDSKGEKQSETTWHRLVAWGKQAEIVENYVKKGSEIVIDGKISNRSYEDKDGKKHYITEILVNSILLLGKTGS